MSMRTQIIESMNEMYRGQVYVSSKDLFDKAIMPAIDEAIKAGRFTCSRCASRETTSGVRGNSLAGITTSPKKG